MPSVLSRSIKNRSFLTSGIFFICVASLHLPCSRVVRLSLFRINVTFCTYPVLVSSVSFSCVNHHYTDTLLLGFSVLARTVCARWTTETTIVTETTVVGRTWQLRFGHFDHGLVHRLWSMWISSSLLNLHVTEVLPCNFGPLSKMVLDGQ